MIGRRITDESVLAKLFTDIGPRNVKRPGGYTRILKIGPRFGDSAEMVVLQLVERKEEEAKAKPEAKKAAKADDKKPVAKKENSKKSETSSEEPKKASPRKKKTEDATAKA